MTNELSDEDTRIYQLAQEQKLDPVRAVIDNRKIATISDPKQRMHQRRHLTGVTLPLNPDDEEMTDFVAVSKNWQGRFEHLDSRVESIISQAFESEPTRKYRAFHYLEPADNLIRSISEKAMRNFPVGIDAAPAQIIAIAPSRPGEYWKISSVESLHMVMDLLSLDIHCDLDLMRNTDIGPCLDKYSWLRKLKKQDENGCVDKDGLPNPHQREFIPNYFGTAPFAVGNVIALARICTMCYGAWLYQNHVDTTKIGIIEPISDGFGSVGGGPITKSEYKWDPKVVEQVRREWHLRNSRWPSTIELQTALQDAEFVGEGSEEPQKITDKRAKHRKS